MPQKTARLTNKYFQRLYQIIHIRYQNVDKSFCPQDYHAMERSAHKDATIKL